MWASDGYDIEQTMGVCSYHSWYVDVRAADHSDGAVLSYPNIHKDFHNWGTGEEPAISSFDTITSAFAHTSPDVGTYNVAYDVWLNGVASNGSTELMIWTENRNQVPGGSKVGTATVSGHTWDVWASRDNKYLAFVAPTPIRAGTLDLKAFLTYLVGASRLPASSTLGQVDYGVEVVDTDNTMQHFDFTNFNVSTS
jgi:hypothetical protein